jgi:Chitobiase/beta-hexosaminidase C-terminal domain
MRRLKEETMTNAVAAAPYRSAGGRFIRRNPRGRTAPAPLLIVALLHALSAHAQPSPVLQRGYDANVSGATLSETTLNTSNVAPGSFGLAFTLSVNDSVYAQPLYVPGVTINGASHNVVYVATMSDTLYAFDADTGGAPLWQRNLAAFENATPVPIAQFAYSGNQNITGNLGILSTPVIDPSTGTLYTVACTLENGTMVYRLHAVDITTGAPRAGSGVAISGAYGAMTFDARNQWQRMSLSLVGNSVVFGFGALELEGTGNLYSGWVMAYGKGTLAQTGIFATVTSGNGGGGVWQSGRPPAVDSSGYVYLFTGNGYNGTGYDGVHNFTESLLKLNPSTGLSLVDWFTPSDWSTLDDEDLDLASAGPTLLPGTGLIVGGGKAGVLYLLNTGGLGKETAGDSGALQEFGISQLRGGPVYWQRSTASGGPLLYVWGVNDALKAFPFNGSKFATTPSATGSVASQAYPGGILTLSANGSTPGTGVVWATVSTSGNSFNGPTPGALYAFDAGNVATELWNSNLNAADSLGTFGKLAPPLVANGRVYVATGSQEVVVYGLKGMTGTPSAAAPTFTPGSGTYSAAQSVTLSDPVSGASIYYTTNGTTPTISSSLYSAPIKVNSTTTIEAIAVAGGYLNSQIASATYVINTGAATAISLGSAADVVGIANNGSAVPNGGLDGAGDAYSETLLGTSLSWNGNAYVFGTAGVADAVANATIALPAGNYATLTLLGAGVNGNQPNQTFIVNYSDGTSSRFTQSVSDWFRPQSYAGETTVLRMAYRVASTGALDNRTFNLYGYSFALNSAKTAVSLTLPSTREVVVLAVDVSAATRSTAAPVFSPAAGSYSSTQSVTLSDTTSGAKIYYTTNGTTPTTSSSLYSASITVSSTTTIAAIAVASGYSNSAMVNAMYTISTGAATQVSLARSANVDGVVNNGSAPANGGLDNDGYAYSEALLGTSLTWNGNTYVFAGAGVPDAVANATIALPAGNYTTLTLLGAGVNGNQADQTFIVNYNDGTSSNFTQSVSDWGSPQNYQGETTVLKMGDRVTPSGAVQNDPFNLYGYSFALDSSKSAMSLTLPSTRDVVVLAVDVTALSLSGGLARGRVSASSAVASVAR